MNLIKIKLKRIILRLFWKIFPYSDKQVTNYLYNYKTSGNYPKVKTVDETINKLLSGNYSLARYGDGEYLLAMDRPIQFQENDIELRKRLQEILKNPDSENCLVAITEFRTERLTSFWKKFWFENVKDISCLMNNKLVYYNQSITREVNLNHFDSLIKIWENRNLLFVMGKGSRFDSGHELFKNAKGFQIVYGLPTNAWKNYKDLFEEVKSTASKIENPLVICALGPTATVLAYDLSKLNIQSLDLGHLTNVYDRLKYNAQAPESLSFTK